MSTPVPASSSCQQSQLQQPVVIFAGAGPGAADLITLRARQALDSADLVMYAGSLVNPLLLSSCKEGCRIEDSSHLDLDDQVRILAEAARKGLKVVRLHSGDPSLYGAMREQIQGLAKEGVGAVVIPGVTSAFAAAASLCLEYTVPNISQTLIFTRSRGRTPLPESQSPAVLAKTGASLVFYLSSGHFKELTRELQEEGGLAPSTPCAIVCRASWDDERVLRGTLADITAQAEAAGIQRQALLLVGEALGDPSATKSLLYANSFSHGYRNTLQDETFTGSVAVLAYSEKGRTKAMEICQGLGSQAQLLPAGTKLSSCWNSYAGIVCVGATGLVMRLAAPLLRDKATDPALVSIDDTGRFAVSLASGHLGGANRLARRVARITGGQAVVSTATDSNSMVAFDEAAAREGVRILNTKAILACNKALLEGRAIDFCGPEDIWKKYWADLDFVHLCRQGEEPSSGICVYWDVVPPKGPGARTLCISSKSHVLGAGCHSGLAPEEFCRQALDFLAAHKLDSSRIAAVASIESKAAEPAIQALVQTLDCPFMSFGSDELARVTGTVTTSTTVHKYMGTSSVSEAAALAAARTLGSRGTLDVPRETREGCMTFALARIGHNAPAKDTQPASGRGMLVVAGLGSGHADSITPEVRRAILEADVIAGYTVYTAFVRPILEAEGMEKEFVESGMRSEIERCRKALELAGQGKNVCLVCSGDPGILAMAGLILEMRAQLPEFSAVPVKVLPGVSAALLAAARLGAPLQNGAVLLSLSDMLVPADEVRKNMQAALGSALSVAIYNPAGRKRRDLLHETVEFAKRVRTNECWCAMVRHAGRPEETVWIGQLRDLPEEQVDMSTLLIIGGNRMKYVDGCLFEARGYADKYADKLDSTADSERAHA